MRDYELDHLSDAALIRDLGMLVSQDRNTTASLLAYLAEVDERRLYAPAGYPSMFAYCVEELRFSEDAAAKRIQAARAAHRFPVLLEVLAEGKLHLTAVCVLAPHLRPENAGELIEAATHRRKAEIEVYLAGRFPSPEMGSSIRPVAARSLGSGEHAPAHVDSATPSLDEVAGVEPGSLFSVNSEHAPAHVPTSRIEVVPERFLVKMTISSETHAKLKYAQALLSHAIPTGEVAEVFDRALGTLIAHLEKRKIGSARKFRGGEETPGVGRRRPMRGLSANSRYVPAHIRRAVWERDQGQCTFKGNSGHRCAARRFLEFDHVNPVARGGTATVQGLRLRCRTHNQLEAERVFGAGFMSRKREEATKEREQAQDIVAGLRSLGCGAHEARRAAEYAQTLEGATFEEQMRRALVFVSRGSVRGRVPAPGRESAHSVRPSHFKTTSFPDVLPSATSSL